MIYSKEDAEEVRREYFRALRNNSGRPLIKRMVTFNEYAHIKEAGRDVSKYEIYDRRILRRLLWDSTHINGDPKSPSSNNEPDRESKTEQTN
jgi:hypothetical protein